METIKAKIENILSSKLPKFATKVTERKKFLGNDTYLAIFIASTFDKTINNVELQYPDFISLTLNNKLELEFQGFGGCGGQMIYRNIDKTNDSEKYLAMKGEKIPFRKPQTNEKAVLSAIEKVCDKYIEALKDIQKRGLLRYTDLVDYDMLLK